MSISYLEAFTMHDISATKFVAELIVKGLNPKETTTFDSAFSRCYKNQSDRKFDTHNIVDLLFNWSSTGVVSECESINDNFYSFCREHDLEIQNTAEEIINDFVAFYYNNLEG